MVDERLRLNELLQAAEEALYRDNEAVMQAQRYILEKVVESFSVSRKIGENCRNISVNPQQHLYPISRDEEAFIRTSRKGDYESVHDETYLPLKVYMYIKSYLITHESIYDLAEIRLMILVEI